MASHQNRGKEVPHVRESAIIGTSGPLNLDRHFVAVEYPGYVKNVDKALETLGGEQAIAGAIPSQDSNTKRFLELRFRPQDPFCHQIYGDHVNTANLLAKVTRKKKKRKGSTEIDRKYDVEIMGIIDNTFKFKGMADFQYLTSGQEARKKQKTVDTNAQLIDIIESGRQLQQKVSNKEEDEEDVPMELPPPIFSKIDMPQDYGFQRNKTFHLEEIKSDSNIPQYRLVNPPKKMYNPICYSSYLNQEVPQEPIIDLKTVLENEKEELASIAQKTKELFDQRPIWTLPALKANLPHQVYSSTNPLKKILPCIAYYVKNGPWRMMWVKFGYDPKQNPESKMYPLKFFKRIYTDSIYHGTSYQGIDLRLNASLFKSQQPLLVNRNPRRLKKGETIKLQQLQDLTMDDEDTSKAMQDEYERKILVHKLLVPPIYRQTIYQLCDIENNEIQELVKSSSKPCDFKSGWLKAEDLKKLRVLLKDIAGKLLSKDDHGNQEQAEEEEKGDEEKEIDDQELLEEYQFDNEEEDNDDEEELM